MCFTITNINSTLFQFWRKVSSINAQRLNDETYHHLWNDGGNDDKLKCHGKCVLCTFTKDAYYGNCEKHLVRLAQPEDDL